MSDELSLAAFRPDVDQPVLEALWRAALAPVWPYLPGAAEAVQAGLVAWWHGQPLGLIAVDLAGGIQLLLVDPAHQRRGIGTILLDTALADLAARGTTVVSLGSGGDRLIWPGVPLNLPDAVHFFSGRGWQQDEIVADLVHDLRDYETPPGTFELLEDLGCAVGLVEDTDEWARLLAFEAAHFPHWSAAFERGDHGAVVVHDPHGQIIGSLLLRGPAPGALYAPLLGTTSGSIGHVGIAEHARGHGIGTAMVAHASEVLRDVGTRTCHIAWTLRATFYGRLGYLPWQHYVMSRRRLLPPAADQ